MPATRAIARLLGAEVPRGDAAEWLEGARSAFWASHEAFLASPTRERCAEFLRRGIVLEIGERNYLSFPGPGPEAQKAVAALLEAGGSRAERAEALSMEYCRGLSEHAFAEYERVSVSEAKAYGLVDGRPVVVSRTYHMACYPLSRMLAESERRQELRAALKDVITLDEAYRIVREIDPEAYKAGSIPESAAVRGGLQKW
jgi:hypothetical protein